MGEEAKISRWLLGLEILVTGIASLVLGLVVGYLTGQSGPDRTALLAALLPAVISAGGLVVFSRLGSDRSPVANILPSLGVLIFAIGLYCGVAYGEKTRKDGADKAAAINLELQNQLLQHRKSILEECSIQEYRLNRGREELGLKPVPLKVVCGHLLP